MSTQHKHTVASATARDIPTKRASETWKGEESATTMIRPWCCWPARADCGGFLLFPCLLGFLRSLAFFMLPAAISSFKKPGFIASLPYDLHPKSIKILNSHH